MKRTVLTSLLALLLITTGFLFAETAVSQDDVVETFFMGNVTDADTGDDLEGAYIYIYSSVGGRDFYTQTNSEGYYEINVKLGGDYHIYCWFEDYEQGYAFESIEQGQNKTVDFELVPISFDMTVYGNVYDMDTGDPIPGAYVELEFLDEVDGGYMWYTTTTNGEGNYQFEPQYEGNYTISAWAENYDPYQMGRTNFFYLEHGENKEINIGMEMIDNGIMGYVTDEDGNAVEGAMVMISNNMWSSFNVSGSDGYYEIRAPQGNYDLEVRAQGFRPYSDEIEIREGELTRKNIELQNAPVLSIIQRIIQLILSILGGL